MYRQTHKKMSTTTDLLIARNGLKFTDSGSAISGATFTENYIYIVINEDAVVSTLTSSDGTNLVTEIGIAAKTISKGMILSAPTGQFLTAVTLASGSALAVKGTL